LPAELSENVRVCPSVDQRRGLFRACKAKGRVIVCAKPDIGSRSWESDMVSLVRLRAADKGVELADDVCSFLVEIIGTDTGRVDGELEKLICYCGGPDQAITAEAVQEVCVGQGEAVSWALSNALGRRDLSETLHVVDVLVRQGKDPERSSRSLLMQTVSFFRQLLQVRILMQMHRLRSAQQVQWAVEQMSEEERASCQEDGLEFVTFHPYRIRSLAQQGLHYNGRELAQSICHLRDAYWKCVSSQVSDRVVLEETLIRLVGVSQSKA